MKIELLTYTPLHTANIAIRTCWGSESKSDTLPTIFCKHCKTNMIAVDYDKETKAATCVTCGSNVEHFDECGEKDRKLIHRVGNQYKHSSTLEHLSYSFKIEDVSRALLQELARHRISSFSVRSSQTITITPTINNFFSSRINLISTMFMVKVFFVCIMTL